MILDCDIGVSANRQSTTIRKREAFITTDNNTSKPPAGTQSKTLNARKGKAAIDTSNQKDIPSQTETSQHSLRKRNWFPCLIGS